MSLILGAETPQREKTVRKGDIGDSCIFYSGFPELPVHCIEPVDCQIVAWADTVYFMKNAPEGRFTFSGQAAGGQRKCWPGLDTPGIVFQLLKVLFPVFALLLFL